MNIDLKNGLIMLALAQPIAAANTWVWDYATNGRIIDYLHLNGASNAKIAETRVDIYSGQQYAAFYLLDDCISSGREAINKEGYKIKEYPGHADFRQLGFWKSAKGSNPLTGSFQCSYDTQSEKTDWLIILASSDHSAKAAKNKLWRYISQHQKNLKAE